MQIKILRKNERGGGEFGWLHARYSFSFSHYYNPEWMNFGALRVFNDDQVDKAKGFDLHPHANMEIVTIVLEGVLEHRDSMGNVHKLHPHEVQAMSAGTGVMHSEYNASATDPVKLLQIWIHPRQQDVSPQYDQQIFVSEMRRNRFQTLASGYAKEEVLSLCQDAIIARGNFDSGTKASYTLQSKNNGVYVFVITGSIDIMENQLMQRDSVGIWEVEHIEFTTNMDTDLLIVEVPMKY